MKFFFIVLLTFPILGISVFHYCHFCASLIVRVTINTIYDPGLVKLIQTNYIAKLSDTIKLGEFTLYFICILTFVLFIEGFLHLQKSAHCRHDERFAVNTSFSKSSRQINRDEYSHMHLRLFIDLVRFDTIVQNDYCNACFHIVFRSHRYTSRLRVYN